MGSLKKEEETEEFEEETKDAILYVNGVRKVLPDGLAHFTLLEYLRDMGLTGTKLGCGEGGCGACTVMVSQYDKSLKKCVHYAVNACLAPLYSVEGMHVITVEGVGNRKHGLHPVQESLAQAHGSQCGFCTPGFIMSMYALLRSSPTPPTEEQIEECLAGNLCRCTGYRPIVDAFRVFAKSNDALYSDISPPSLQGGEFVCPSTGKPCSCGSKAVTGKDSCQQTVVCGNEYKPLCYSDIDGSTYTKKELIFPPELLLRKNTYLNLSGFGGLKWYRPLKLRQVLELKAKYPDAKLLVGNTEVGIEMRLKNIRYQVLISVTHVPEFNVLSVKDDGLEIGAAVRLSKLLKTFKKIVTKRAAHETSSCKAFIEQLKWFAGTQIKNVASVGGNICTASPISDLNPLWMAARASFRIIDCKGNIRTTQAENFFLGYRKVDLTSGETLLSIFLPWTRRYEYVKEFKQAHRRDDDIAIVNAGMRVSLEEKGDEWVVLDASIVYGGVAPLSLCATKTQEYLIGKRWSYELLQGALKVLQTDISIKEDAPGGMVEFRKSLTSSFFYKFFLYVINHLDENKSVKESVPLSHMSAIQTFHRPSLIASQDYEIRKRGTSVGSPEVHMSSRLQVTGEAEYADDTPMPSNGLHAALVLSRKPHARILSIDDSGAKSSPGFVGIYFAKDVPGDNGIGPVVTDEEVFASEFVTCVGQVIGVVVADTQENAKHAARNVHVEYEELPAILSIQEALDANSFHPNTEKCLRKGDVDLCFQSGVCDKIIEGEVQVGGQEHFYLEPQCSLVWTMDGGNEVHMISSTQAPQKHQKYVSHVLGLPMSKVVCKTKRIGGGFGGKETRSANFAAMACVPSYLLNRPVKLTLDRDIDMMITGQRHSFLGKYKIGFTNEGKVLALDLAIYNNAGNSLDLSLAILERAMFHSDNVYEIPNIRVVGRVCFTNLPSNTAFRGFGGPQGMLIAENWIQRIAVELNKCPEEIREINFQGEGSILHYGHTLQHCTLALLWNELKVSCDFPKARKEIDEFNLHNRWKKRGIAMVPTKFGISFTTKLMNQAGALVHVYTDGTVLVTHGGVEMGQGLHTKVAQVAASAFNIPLNSVFISETSTDKVPNSSPTAASASSDMYGAAVLDACEQIKARMEPIASKHKFSSFAELANACYVARIDLSAHGFFIVPEIGFDWETGKGNPFRYFTYGAAFAEVEVDTLTGDFHTRTANLFMDLGYSINPAIDIGQVEGAFAQGLGWVALEELKWGDPAHKWIRSGCLYTCGPGSYKIPSVNDVPFKFSVSLLKGHPNVKALHSSKAVGEPPFFLASAVFFAIKDAIMAARAEVGHNEWFPLDNPATPERIRMACLDEFTTPFISSDFRPKLSV
ncbi:Fer2 domain-containing protein/FAD_binding_5 domain-containing protein/Ald_Xan_dh_C domain-containing protein/Fer2_2 domain-containing protein/Ald_Xan_dh_C2 domain-containing protein/CO_deh_flav_C domain-containing protein [Cephalotus follicularis]|uniref:Fer2 domain-containing protein/FAD_binding_5 domain-containing protein/Ald_Xan_dh_C domain-containing protein/Fer2_2 domain-containing protein/Ald_Xan_dh_C2 domain-containing protein/CO_deh_flav_C... n=1 Tax=Cephalotus follicularis TaxID=3775 RepID=A0A1Q3BYQ2_CEPFO|nr:Fer2 domain-containing protein/FAD_binding_5 domain-containing protein/Ald_Xan_dh_C domain-containing protein/Fer2_2 domain-containing protein/Ald_Xan_dh_C2 domain-containing protein/CO_deh_flav_C domain-containing protein [Cephalotus follicularis]